MNQHGTNLFNRGELASLVQIFFFQQFYVFSPQLRESRFTTEWTGSTRKIFNIDKNYFIIWLLRKSSLYSGLVCIFIFDIFNTVLGNVFSFL